MLQSIAGTCDWLATFFLYSQAAESGGVVVVVGLGKPEITMPVVDFLVREVDVRGIFRYVNW
jgi:threonine dehydrogenase-like Zn-dependent dehydrogenase